MRHSFWDSQNFVEGGMGKYHPLSLREELRINDCIQNSRIRWCTMVFKTGFTFWGLSDTTTCQICTGMLTLLSFPHDWSRSVCRLPKQWHLELLFWHPICQYVERYVVMQLSILITTIL